MLLAHARNRQVLASLARRGPGKPEYAAHDAVPNAYLSCGCHPDIVARLWDELGAALPTDCRCLVHGTPALAEPRTGLILAVGMGTQYGLRIPALTPEEAAGLRTLASFADTASMDIHQLYGDDWVFGDWSAREPAWCRSVFELQVPMA